VVEAERTIRVKATGNIDEYSITKNAPFGNLGALHVTVANFPTTLTLSTLALTTGVAACAAGKKLKSTATRVAKITFSLYFTVTIVLYEQELPHDTEVNWLSNRSLHSRF
jgi:hypothetical protein